MSQFTGYNNTTPTPQELARRAAAIDRQYEELARIRQELQAEDEAPDDVHDNTNNGTHDNTLGVIETWV